MPRKDWKIYIREYEGVRGSISQKEFCKERGLSLAQFKYYLKVQREEDLYEKEEGRFIEAHVEGAETVYEELKLRLRGGLELLIPAGFDEKSLKRVIKVLE